MEPRVYGIGESDEQNWTRLTVKESSGVMIEQKQHIKEGEDRIETVYLSSEELQQILDIIK